MTEPDRTRDDDSGCLRLTMTLPGSASLGAFQAGAVSALAEVVHELRDCGRTITIDAIGGASAGSIVGMLFAHAMTTGRDVTRLMADAWVDEIDVGLLCSGDRSSPLGFDALRSELSEFLADEREHPFGVNRRLDSPVSLHVALTSLLGFERPIDPSPHHGVQTSCGGPSVINTISYVDWISFDFEPDHSVETLTQPNGRSPIDAALVSAAHPIAFEPRPLDRSEAADSYQERGIVNVPDDGMLWYIDGGLVESEPVGTVLRKARERRGAQPGRRIHFVVDPRSSGPSSGRQWGIEEGDRSWIDGLRRSLSILPTQALHDDLRRIAAINHRLAAIEEIVERLSTGAGGTDRERLRNDLLEAAGLAGKEHVELEIISPLLVAEDDGGSVQELLAGDFVGAFGGFLERDVRRSDFGLGWRSTMQWVENSLADFDVEDHTVQRTLDRLASDGPDTGDEGSGCAGVEQLGWRSRWQLARVAGRAGRILVGEALPDPSLPVPSLGDLPWRESTGQGADGA